MNYVIIYAHPNRDSLNGSILTETLAILENKQDTEVKVIDLYADKFNPSLFFDKTQLRRNLYTRDDTKDYRDTIAWADHLVFIYPIWWGRSPAILLGFIDKVFTAGFAYRTAPQAIVPQGLFKNKRATIITTQNGPVGITRLIYGDTHRILMKRQVLQFCGIKKVRFFEIGKSESMSTSRFSQIVLKLRKLFLHN